MSKGEINTRVQILNEGAEIVHIWNLEKFHEKTHFPHQMQRAII